jgi:hypothetical protein
VCALVTVSTLCLPSQDQWNYAKPDATLFLLDSTFTKAQLNAFVNSQAWGPLNVNISSVADLKVSLPDKSHHRLFRR